MGGEVIFERFLKSYVSAFKGCVIETNDFVSFFNKYFGAIDNSIKLKEIDWNNWLYDTGLPKYVPQFDESCLDQIIGLANR